MTTSQLNSLLVRLQRESALKVNDTLRELLESPDALDKVVQIVESRIDAGTYFTNDLLASLLSRIQSPSLYKRVREQLIKNNWTAVKLYECSYPDSQIEKNLCSELYEIASDDANPLRSHIVDAMRGVGSEELLPTLEAILFDLEPTAKIRTMFGESLGLLASLEAQSRAEFVKRVALAIDDIKIRAAATAETQVSGTFSSEGDIAEQVDETDNATRAKTLAQGFIDEHPEIAILYIRKGAEALAKNLYRRLGCEQNGKPAKKMMLEELLKPIKESKAPDVFKLLIQTFQIFGNFATHDQDNEERRFVTKNIAVALLALYDEALSIYSTMENLA